MAKAVSEGSNKRLGQIRGNGGLYHVEVDKPLQKEALQSLEQKSNMIRLERFK